MTRTWAQCTGGPGLLRSLIALLSGALLLGAALVHAQDQEQLDWDPKSADVARFADTRWSLSLPDRDHEGGCLVGFLAFRFMPTGHFIYNNKIRGAWRIDELGNLSLRTREGLRFTLLVEGDTLRPAGNTPFLRRMYVYRRCSEQPRQPNLDRGERSLLRGAFPPAVEVAS